MLAVVIGGGMARADTNTTGLKGEYADRIVHLQNLVDTLRSRQDLSDQVRKQAISNYKQAISSLQSAQSSHEQTAKLRKQAEGAPKQISHLRHQLANLKKPESMAHLTDLSIADLSSRIEQQQKQLADAKADLSDLRDQLDRAAQAPETLRQTLSDARDKLQTSTGASSASDHPAQKGSVHLQSENALVSAQRAALNAKIQRLQEQLSDMDKHKRLLEARRSLAEAKVARLNDSLARLQTVLTHKQKISAKSLQNASNKKINDLRGTLKPITQAAQQNVKLSRRLSEVTQNTQKLVQHQTRLRQKVNDLERRQSLAQRELEIGGGSVTLSQVLRQQRRHLANPMFPFPIHGSPIDQQDIASMELKRFQLQETRPELNKPETLADQLARQANVELTSGQHTSLVNLLKQRRSILDNLIRAEGRYINIGRNLRGLSRQYQHTLSSFNQLLDERLFWLPSFHPVGPAWPEKVLVNVPWLFSPDNWQQLAKDFVSGVVARPIRLGVWAAIILALIVIRRPIRHQMSRLAEPVGNVRRDTMWITLHATLLTVLLSLPGILIFFLVSYILHHGSDATRFTQAVAVAMFQLGLLWAFVEPFANICRSNGLADRHFQWPDGARLGMHRLLRWLLLTLIVPVILFGLTEAFGDDAKRETLGRIGFVLGELSIAIFAWRLLHPAKGVLSDVMTSDSGQPWRLGYFWLPLAAGIPLVFSGLAAWGYYYTALQLQTRFFYSAALLGAAVVLYSLIVRWLTLAERRLALARALRKREEAREARASREAAAASGDSTPDNLDDAEIDLVQINEQTRGLIKVVITLIIGTGLWLIWADMIPVLQQLNTIHLWQYTTHADGEAHISRVTLGALLLAIVVVVGTALAGRNLPGFLEITILRRFSVDAGSRYAMATLFKYAIVLIGLLVAANLIGVHWSSVQWLIAALGVGLGFGLQEIFANFVSGLIILFGRSARVGDTVTVGTLTGTISRIRTRATTITDWDNKEVVVPNKTFISETVINWTLRDDITRLILEFSVDLNADGDLVEKLISEAIEAEPLALSTPAPSVFMVGYGDSALHYEARVFFSDLYNLLPLQHALYRRIHADFHRNGIRIVHPQHDLHLRSVDRSVGDIFNHIGHRPDEDKSTT